MIAFLQYIVALVIVQTGPASPGAASHPHWMGIAAMIAAFTFSSRVLGLVLAHRVREARSDPLPAVLLASNVLRIGALISFWIVVVPFGGSGIDEALGLEHLFLVPRLAELAGYMVLTAAATWGLEPVMRLLRVGPSSTLRALLVELRHALITFTPVFAMLVLAEIKRTAPATGGVGRVFEVIDQLPAIQVLFGLAVLLLVMLAIPFVLRLAWRAKPLPPGPLRERLEAYSRRVGFRARDILVWPTGGQILNAAVIGAFPRFRYVMVTDGLLKTLADDEIEAVFAHEAGHARRGHILLFLGFTSVLALAGIVPEVSNLMTVGFGSMSPFVRTLLILLVWVGVVFGWISRRFEQEADVFGLDTLPLPPATEAPSPGAVEGAPAAAPTKPSSAAVQHPFARALVRIGEEAGELREITGWRHFSIADRVDFVRLYLAHPEVRRRYRVSIALLRWSLLVLIAGFALTAVLRLPGEVRDARRWLSEGPDYAQTLLEPLDAAVEADPRRRAELLVQASETAKEAGRLDDAVRWLREAAALGAQDPHVVSLYADLLEQEGRRLGAALWLRESAAATGVSEADAKSWSRRADELENGSPEPR